MGGRNTELVIFEHKYLRTILDSHTAEEKGLIQVSSDDAANLLKLKNVKPKSLPPNQLHSGEPGNFGKAMPLANWIRSRKLVRVRSRRTAKRHIIFIPPNQNQAVTLNRILALNGASPNYKIYSMLDGEGERTAVVLDYLSPKLVRAGIFEPFTLHDIRGSNGAEFACPVGYLHAYERELNWVFPPSLGGGEQEPSDGGSRNDLLVFGRDGSWRKWSVESSHLSMQTSGGAWQVSEVDTYSDARALTDQIALVQPRYSRELVDLSKVEWEEFRQLIVVFRRNVFDGFGQDFQQMLEFIEHKFSLIDQDSKFLIQERVTGQTAVFFHLRTKTFSGNDIDGMSSLLRSAEVYVPSTQDENENIYRLVNRNIVPDIFQMIAKPDDWTEGIRRKLSDGLQGGCIRLIRPSKDGYEPSKWDLPSVSDWDCLYQAASSQVSGAAFRVPTFEGVDKWKRSSDMHDLVRQGLLSDNAWLDPFRQKCDMEVANYSQMVAEAAQIIIRRSEEAEETTKEFNHEITDINRSLEKIRTVLPTLPESISKLVVTLSKVLTSEARNTNNWHSRVKQRQSHLETQSKSIATATEKLDGTTKSVVSKLKQRGQDLESDLDSVKGQVANSKKIASQITSGVKKMEPQIRSSIVKAEEVLEGIRKKRTRVRQSIDELAAQTRVIREKHQGLMSDLEQQSLKNSKLQDELGSLRTTKNRLEEEVQHVSDLKNQIAEVTEVIRILNNKIPEIRTESKRLKASLEREVANRDALQQELQEQTNRHHSLTDQENSVKSSLQSLQAILDSKNSDIQDLNTRIDMATKKRASCQQDLELASTQRQTLTSRISELDKRVRDLERQVRESKKVDSSIYQSEFKDIQSQITRLEHAINSNKAPKRGWGLFS